MARSASVARSGAGKPPGPGKQPSVEPPPGNGEQGVQEKRFARELPGPPGLCHPAEPYQMQSPAEAGLCS